MSIRYLKDTDNGATRLKILPPSYNYPYNLQADEISIKESSVHSAALREITKALRTLRLCEK
jgi:hypothetical protein